MEKKLANHSAENVENRGKFAKHRDVKYYIMIIVDISVECNKMQL